MNKVVKEFHINEYCVMQLDEKKAGNQFTMAHGKYVINGKEYKPVMVNDITNAIAIISDESFIGSEVKFC